VPKEIYEFELTEYALWVPDGFTIDDVNVTLNITHTWAADLDVYLDAPTGTWVLLFAKVGFYGENFVNTVLDDEASTSITSGSAPLSGSYRPQEALSTFDGEPSFGWWVLGIVDAVEGETGTLDSWSLELCGVPD
jgi:subtilisin-like proprotein convertase family protein